MIETLLKPFQRFGVHLGLDRIEKLLDKLGNPHLQVPIIHVTGSNGKGSVCAYLASVLTAAGYRVGRYTSPHLVDWTERICLNDQAIAPETLAELLQEIQATITEEAESPTQFEVLTAAAWLYFARQKVDLAVIEVGLGGRLDATNVCPAPLLSVITSISLEHWQHLGPTIADIAREKAGILKAGCPAVLGKLPPEATTVIKEKLQTLNCPAVWVEPAQAIGEQVIYQGLVYSLPLPGEVQLLNSAIAIAALQCLREQDWSISAQAIQTGLAQTRWPGRLEWLQWQGRSLLVDGAHNQAGAVALRRYLDTLNSPLTLVMGMLSTKDHRGIFEALLRPQDQLYLVPVPDHSTAEPEALASLAWSVCPQLADCQTFEDLFAALEQATQASDRLIVLAGSLYLLGYFYGQVNSALKH